MLVPTYPGCIVPSTNFYGSEILHGVVWGSHFGPGIFWGFDFCPNSMPSEVLPWGLKQLHPGPQAQSPFIFIHAVSSLWAPNNCQSTLGVYHCVKTCQVFLCFLAIIFPWLYFVDFSVASCIHCFKSIVSFTGFYTKARMSPRYLQKRFQCI